MKKNKNVSAIRDSVTAYSKSWCLVLLILIIWQAVCAAKVLPRYMLPSPLNIIAAFAGDFPLLMRHLGATLYEAAAGLLLSIAAAFLFAVLMDINTFIKSSFTPIIHLTQTLPTVAIAPLLVLWMGYGQAPKIALVFLSCFFPVTMGLSGGFASANSDAIKLLKSFGAKQTAIYRYIKIPAAAPSFFTALKIASSYAIIGAIVAEWLGGDSGLGVYMTRVRKSYSFDKMFAVILLSAVLTLLLIRCVTFIEKRAMPWNRLRF